MTKRTPIGALLFLARAGLAENKAITALLVLAIAAGVAFQISNTANLDGYTAEIEAQAVTNSYGQLRVMPKAGARFEVTPELIARLVDPDIEAAVPVIALAGAVGRDGKFRNALVIAIDGGAPRRPYRVVSGAALAPADQHSVLVGIGLAERLGIEPGHDVELRVVTGLPRDATDDGVSKMTMTVRGIAAGTFVAPEAVFVDRGLIASELGTPRPASLIAVYTRSGVDEDVVAARLSTALPDHVVRTWREDSSFATSALHGSMAIGTLSRWMVGFAVIVPVWALLYIHVLHRRRAIAVIAAIGLSRGALFTVYLLQALLVGLAGVAIGIGVGAVAIAWFSSHPIFEWSHVFEIRPAVSIGTYLWPSLLVLGFTLAAAVIPALRAARTDPAAILRGRT